MKGWEIFMKKRWLSMMAAAVIMAGMAAGLAGCSTGSTGNTDASGAETSGESSSEKKVLRVGMECAYAPFNWTQETEEVANGDTAVPIYGQNVMPMDMM